MDYMSPSLHELSKIKDAITHNLLPENNKNNHYFIDDDLMTNHCHDIITDITDPALLISKLNKNPDTHSGLFVEASKVWQALEPSMPIIKYMPEEIFCKVILKNFSINFIHKIIQNYQKSKSKGMEQDLITKPDSDFMLVPMNPLSRSLGETLINQLMLPAFCNVTKLSEPKENNIKNKYIFTYKKYPEKKLLDDLNSLEAQTKLSKKEL